MRKIFLAATAAVISFSLWTLPVSGQSAAAAGGTAYAAYGTPSIDGEKDARYQETMSVGLGTDKTARTEVYALWDYSNLYVYADVWDKTVSHIDDAVFATTPWYSDSLEIFVDRTLSRSSDNKIPYGNIQLRVDTDNNLSGMVNNVIWAGKEKNFEGRAAQSAAKIWEDGGGYSIEIAIPTSVTAPDGNSYSVEYDCTAAGATKRASIGYDLMLNNAIDSSTRQDTYTWSSGVGAPAGWNTLIFMDDVPEELREQGSEKIVLLGNTNVAAGAVAYTDTVHAFDQYTYQAVDNNFETYTQGLSPFWTLTVDLRFETEIARLAVKTHADVYPTEFEVLYYNSSFGEWETVWEAENDAGEILSVSVADQIGKYYITGETITTRFLKFIPKGRIQGGTATYSYALCEFQAFTPDRNQTVTKVSDKTLPFDPSRPQEGGAVTENVPERDIVTAPYSPKKVTLGNKTRLPVLLAVICGSLFIGSATVFIVINYKGRKKR